MKRFLLAVLLAPVPALAQTTPVAPIVKGTALPPPASEEAAVLAPIEGIFAAIAARDGAKATPYLRPEARFVAASERPDGTRTIRVMSAAEWAAFLKPGPERLEEKLINPAVEIDGDIAMVWSNYTFTFGGKLSHCGVDHFDLVREGGSWKILNITWTQRKTGCQ